MGKGMWAHDRFMDVVMEIVKVQYRGSSYFKLKVLWWNKGYTGNPWVLHAIPETITINTRDLKKWKRVSL